MSLQTVQSTRGRRLDLDAYRGKTVVIFYESRDHTDDNLHLKESCGLLLERGSMRERLEVLGVADVRGLGFVRPVVRKAVQVVAQRYGTELWLDFEGALTQEPYRLGRRGASVAVIDPRGELVYRGEGVLDAHELERFFAAFGAALDRGTARRVADRLGERADERRV